MIGSIRKTSLILLTVSMISSYSISQTLPDIITSSTVTDESYLPDFSYAGYRCGEVPIPMISQTMIHATDYGVISDDGLDDSKNLMKAMAAAEAITGPVVLQLPPGRIILSDILYIERSHLVLRGSGSGDRGTEIYCPRPMMYMEDPEALAELREYLVQLDKRQREPQNNIDLPFSQYAWSGGMIWTQVPGERVKSYLGKYDVEEIEVARITSGKKGQHMLKGVDINGLKVGDVVQLQLFNTTGSVNSDLIDDLYKGADVKIGSHHWNFPSLPIVRQEVEITQIEGHDITIKSPLTVSITAAYNAKLVQWNHLEEVGIEHIRISFPDASYIAHHVERGFNGLFLTRLHNSWVKDVVIHNADSGILTEEIANVTIRDIKTTGSNKAHYTVAMAGVHNVLVENLSVYNLAVHPLSFNTFSTKNVYRNCEVFVMPVLDQHSGANHQNLFDQITVHIDPSEDGSYPLFAGGGAGYWKPSHGAYSTFWNIQVRFMSGIDHKNPILLNGMKDGPYARLVGISGNHPVEVQYGPSAHIEMVNQVPSTIPSLYQYQLDLRLKK